jgi:F0F1-type ATP synthase assembly protein I
VRAGAIPLAVLVTKPERGGTTPPSIGLAFDLGLRLGVSVIIGLGGGLLLDSWLKTSPIFTLIGMVLGIGAAMYTIWDVARDAMRR